MSLVLLTLAFSVAFVLSGAVLPVRPTERLNFLPVRVAVGLLLLGVGYVLKERAGLSDGVYFAAVGLVTVAYVALVPRWGRRVAPAFDREDFSPILFAFLVSLVSVIAHGVYMAGGQVPAYVFNVDNAYFLSLAHSFQQADVYPPRFIMSDAPGFNYHHTISGLSALLHEATAVPTHMALLWVLPVIGTLAFVGLAFDLLRQRLSGTWSALMSVLLLTCHIFHLANYVSLPGQLFTVSGRYLAEASQQVSLYGLILVLLAVWGCRRYERRDADGMLVAILIAIPLIKVPYAPLIGLGVGLNYLYHAVRERNPRRMVIPVIGGVGMVAVYALFVSSPGISPGLGIKPLGRMGESQLFSVAVAAFLTAVLYVVARLQGRRFPTATKALFFALPMLAFGLVADIDHRDAWQLTYPMPMLLLLFVMSNLPTSTWAQVAPRRRWATGVAFAAVIGVCLPGVIESASYAARVLADPREGHEVVSSVTLADVLSYVPVSGNVIATNDTRYPADDYLRDDRQFLVSAIYGHACAHCELTYAAELIDEIPRRDRLDDLLQAPRFDHAAFEASAAPFGVSHVLIHKAYPHSAQLPYDLIYENPEYAVYAIQRGSGKPR